MTRRRSAPATAAGFTLVELLAALLILSMLALLSYRGLDAVLDTRGQVLAETEKWRRATAFFARFERDVALAAPRTVRSATGTVPAWIGRPASEPGPSLELSRFASTEGVDAPRRIAYMLNDRHEIELWIWSGLDAAPGHEPVRYPVLGDVTALEFQYLDPGREWIANWPPAGTAVLPRGVRVSVVLASGEEIVRVFAVGP